MNSSFVSLFHHRVILTKAIVMFIRTLLLFIHWHTLYSLCSVSVLQLTLLSNKFIIRDKKEKEEEKRNNQRMDNRVEASTGSKIHRLFS